MSRYGCSGGSAPTASCTTHRDTARDPPKAANRATARHSALPMRPPTPSQPRRQPPSTTASARSTPAAGDACTRNLAVEYLPGDRDPKPLWLWHSDPDASAHDVDRLWRIFLRRFDIEHTFRFWKQTLGMTRPRLRHPAQADRRVWLILAAYTQLRLARTLTDDLRRPWEKPLTPDQLTPGRVRRGYPRIRKILGTPARTPKATRPGPGRPRGRTSSPAPRHPVGKHPHKRDTPGSKEPRGNL